MEIQREKLFDEVWATPISRLCKAYGLSDQGLRKACVKLQIPLPTRGHWAKIAAGHVLAKPALPPLREQSRERKPRAKPKAPPVDASANRSVLDLNEPQPPLAKGLDPILAERKRGATALLTAGRVEASAIRRLQVPQRRLRAPPERAINPALLDWREGFAVPASDRWPWRACCAARGTRQASSASPSQGRRTAPDAALHGHSALRWRWPISHQHSSAGRPAGLAEPCMQDRSS